MIARGFCPSVANAVRKSLCLGFGAGFSATNRSLPSLSTLKASDALTRSALAVRKEDGLDNAPLALATSISPSMLWQGFQQSIVCKSLVAQNLIGEHIQIIAKCCLRWL